VRIKRRKNLLLSESAVAQGERLAAASGLSLSGLVEKKLLAGPKGEDTSEHYWPKALKPQSRANDPRYSYLAKKHR
jgi:hypothetical protein